MNVATIPSKLYVTVQYRNDAANENSLLGFASPYTKDKAFAKRKATQDVWAYGPGVEVNISDIDDVTVVGSGGRFNGYEYPDAGALFITNSHPRIVDNTPVDGFEIAKSVRRFGWNGGGNVKWRITDPRGFDIEVSSENFASIVDCSTIVNGVIQGKCCWGRIGSSNILLPVLSEPYKQAETRTKSLKNLIPMSSIKPGDLVQVLTGFCKNKTVEYKGSFYAIRSESVYNGPRNKYKGRKIIGSVKKAYFFQDIQDGNVYISPSVKIGAIEGHNSPEPESEFINRVNDGINKDLFGGFLNGISAYDIVFISDEDLTTTQVTFELVPDSFNYTPGGLLPKKQPNGANSLLFCKVGDKLFATDRISAYLTRIVESDLLNGFIRPFDAITDLQKPFVNAPFFKLKLSYNNKSYILDSHG